MQLGSHVPAPTPLVTADRLGMDVVQLHLSAPRQWRDPLPRADADELRGSGRVAAAHATYLCNPASANPDVRAKSWHALQATLDAAATVGAAGVVVHAGQAGPAGTVDEAVERWVEGVGALTGDVPLLIENTASGQAAPGRALADWIRLVLAVREVAAVPIGVCLDTCHAFAGDPDAASDPAGWTRALRDAVGAVDLLHVNDSGVAAGAGRDRHARLGQGAMGLDTLAGFVTTAGAPAALLETPGDDDERVADLAVLAELVG
ncbi:MAG: TIM barrel protein [Actinomycetes bacterium]